MTHEEFLAFVKSLLGKLPHFETRDPLSRLIRSKGFEFHFVDKWIPKGLLGSNANNPLLKVDGVNLELGFCNDDAFTIYVPEENRK